MFLITATLCAASTYQFQAWMAKHGKSYKDDDEELRREKIFHDNARRIAEMNAGTPGVSFEMNKFGDLTQAEFDGFYNGFAATPAEIKNMRETTQEAKLDTRDTPDDWDWRDHGKVSAPVQDQGQCGSCWAFSATANAESLIAIQNDNADVVKLSEQALVDCDHLCGQYRMFNGCDNACNGGLMPNAWKYAIASKLPTSASYKYTARGSTCKTYTGVANFTNWEFIAVDEEQMRAYTATKGPVAVAVQASKWQFYKSGIVAAGSNVCAKQDPKRPSLNHAVTVVGYTPEYWIVKNSWGVGWGEQGYIRLAMDQDVCGVALFACSVIV